MKFERGDLVFFKTPKVDLLCIVLYTEETQQVPVRLLDAPNDEVLFLPLDRVEKLCDKEEEPPLSNVGQAISHQRQITIPQKQRKVKEEDEFENIPDDLKRELIEFLIKCKEERRF